MVAQSTVHELIRLQASVLACVVLPLARVAKPAGGSCKTGNLMRIMGQRSRPVGGRTGQKRRLVLVDGGGWVEVDQRLHPLAAGVEMAVLCTPCCLHATACRMLLMQPPSLLDSGSCSSCAWSPGRGRQTSRRPAGVPIRALLRCAVSLVAWVGSDLGNGLPPTRSCITADLIRALETHV